MTEYTKGPWTVDPCWDIIGNTNDGNGLVCAVTHDAVPREEACANARLISAAPDMYDALKNMLNLHLAHHNHPIHAAARSALAKANGHD